MAAGIRRVPYSRIEDNGVGVVIAVKRRKADIARHK